MRVLTREAKYSKNFYVLDTETSGFVHNEPIQVSAIRYEDGKPAARHNQYFMPKKEITDSAYRTHGLDELELYEKGAKRPSKGKFEILINFPKRQKGSTDSGTQSQV